MKLILGSQSKGRAQVLRDAGFEFRVMHADIDEKAIRSENFEELPLLIARAKAAGLLPRISEPAYLITADLVIVCNGELREKPISYEEAERFLKSYSNNEATKAFRSNTCKCSMPSPNPMYFTGILN